MTENPRRAVTEDASFPCGAGPGRLATPLTRRRGRSALPQRTVRQVGWNRPAGRRKVDVAAEEWRGGVGLTEGAEEWAWRSGLGGGGGGAGVAEGKWAWRWRNVSGRPYFEERDHSGRGDAGTSRVRGRGVRRGGARWGGACRGSTRRGAAGTVEAGRPG